MGVNADRYLAIGEVRRVRTMPFGRDGADWWRERREQRQAYPGGGG